LTGPGADRPSPDPEPAPQVGAANEVEPVDAQGEPGIDHDTPSNAASDSGPIGHPAPVADPDGPPGGGVFSLEGRRAPGLYLVAWILSIGGLAVTLVLGPMASDPAWRPLLIFLGATAVTLGLAAAAGSQVLERASRDPERYRGPSPLLVFGLYFMALSALGIIVINVIGVDPDVPSGFFANATIQTLGYVLVISLFAVRTGALSWSDMGWPTWRGADVPETLRAIGSGILVMLPVTLGLIVVGGIVGLLLGVEAPRQFPLSEAPIDGAFVALSAGLIVPIGEEIFFRGFVLTAWMRDLGPRTALIRSSLFFALLHLVPLVSADFSEGWRQAVMVIAVLLPVGFVFGWVFIRFGLIASIAAHVSYNSLLLALAFLASKIPEPAGI